MVITRALCILVQLWLLCVAHALFSQSFSDSQPYVKLEIATPGYANYSGFYIREASDPSRKCGAGTTRSLDYQPTNFYRQGEGAAYLYTDGSPVFRNGSVGGDFLEHNRLVLTSITLNHGKVDCADVDFARNYILTATGIANGAGNGWHMEWSAQDGTPLNATICDVDCALPNATEPTIQMERRGSLDLFLAHPF